jgi:pimeloyl-ACP methyl ester carboxylesterase
MAGDSYAVHLVDLKGHGNSPKPRDRRYSVEDQADLVLDYIRAKGLNDLTLIGHSMGGRVALRTAMKMLECKDAALNSLILIGCAAYPQKTPDFIRLLRAPILGNLACRLLPSRLLSRIALRRSYHDRSKIGDDSVTAYAANLKSSEGISAVIEAAKGVIPGAATADFEQYSRLKVPTLLIWGREDRVIPLRIAEMLKSDIAGSRLAIVDRCGHIPHEERPETIIPMMIDFIAPSESPDNGGRPE